MFNWIIGSSLKYRFIVIALAVGMIYFGYGQIRSMPVDVFPEFSPPLVEVQTPALGLSPEEVEELVKQQESALAQSAGMGRYHATLPDDIRRDAVRSATRIDDVADFLRGAQLVNHPDPAPDFWVDL